MKKIEKFFIEFFFVFTCFGFRLSFWRVNFSGKSTNAQIELSMGQ